MTALDFMKWRQRQCQLKYDRTMEERRLFMSELKKSRRALIKNTRKEITENIGPTWYQVLSVSQRVALDDLSRAIYQDKIEDLPVRTTKVIRDLGIIPCPNSHIVQHCIYLSPSDDPQEFLAQLFITMYHHPISSKRYMYDLNMKIIMSGIYYLGLNELINSLKELFKPDKQDSPSHPKNPRKKPAQVNLSPYLQTMSAPLYRPAKPKSRPPLPLPDLSFLNETIELELSSPPILKPPPLTPAAPLPKKRVSRSECDKIAEVIRFEPIPKQQIKPVKTPVSIKRPVLRRFRSSKLSLQDTKKKYGIGDIRGWQKKNHQKLKPFPTDLPNVKFMIIGVYTYKGDSYFIIGDVIATPTQGVFLNGGFAVLPNGEYMLINQGVCTPTPIAESCECLEKWERTTSDYVRNTKCDCDHRYDFRHEGRFPEDEIPFFTKPTTKGPMGFNYNAIYEMDPMNTKLQLEFKKHWDQESILQDEGDSEEVERKKKKKKKDTLRELSEPPKKTCLGNKPVIEDYLRCGIRSLAGVMKVVALLPDIHICPELREWMRLRVYGPYTIKEKEDMFIRSARYWMNFKILPKTDKAALPIDPSFYERTTWKYKSEINKKFKKVLRAYQIELFRAQAHMYNQLWATTHHAEYPDKKFREIFFTYLEGRVSDVVLYHPYCQFETTAAKMKRRRISK